MAIEVVNNPNEVCQQYMFDMESPLSKHSERRIFCLLGRDWPIHESFASCLICQRKTMEHLFVGMADIPFIYKKIEGTCAKFIFDIKSLMTEEDKKFLINFELGQPEWDGYEFEYFKDYPSVQKELLNLKILARQNS